MKFVESNFSWGPLAVLGFLAPVLAVFSPRGIVPLSVVVSIVLLFNREVRAGWWVLVSEKRLFLATFGALLAWGLISSLWAPDPERTLMSVLKLLAGAIMGLTLVVGSRTTDGPGATRVMLALKLGISLALLYLTGDAITKGAFSQLALGATYREDYGFFWLKSPMVVVSLLSWVAFLSRRKIHWVLSFGGVAFLCWLALSIGSKATFVALVAACLVTLLAWVLKSRFHSVAAICLAGVVLTMPLLPIFAVDPTSLHDVLPRNPSAMSVVQRLYIWEIVGDRITQKPVHGWGLNASRSIAQDIFLSDLEMKITVQGIPLHPHNGALQVWLELGMVGAVLFAALLAQAVLWMKSATTYPRENAAEAGLLAIIVTIALVSFSILSSWWLALIWITAALSGVARIARSRT